MTILDIQGLDRFHGQGVHALADVDLRVESGEVVGLLGRNGAGKTTLLRIAMAMLTPHAGSVRVFERDPWEHPVSTKQRIGYVAEDQILPVSLSVTEILELHKSLFPTWDDAFAKELLRRFQLRPRQRIRSLSKGQARQVALLCAAAHRPQLLLLDEPAGGLDPAARREFLETTILLLNEAGSTVVFSSHNLADVERIAERIVLLHEGRVLVDSPVDVLREHWSLAVFANGSRPNATELRAIEGCRAVRDHGESLHALFEHPADLAIQAVQTRLEVAPSHCRPLPLEELFIELVEGQK